MQMQDFSHQELNAKGTTDILYTTEHNKQK